MIARVVVVLTLVSRNNPPPKTARTIQESKFDFFRFTMSVLRPWDAVLSCPANVIGGESPKRKLFCLLG